LLCEPQLVRAARIAAVWFARQVLRLERDLRARRDVVGQARIQGTERREVDRVTAAAAVELRQELAAPVVRNASREPPLFENPRDVEAVAETEKSEGVGVRVGSALEAYVAEHLRQRCRYAEPSVAEEVLTLKLQPMDV